MHYMLQNIVDIRNEINLVHSAHVSVSSLPTNWTPIVNLCTDDRSAAREMHQTRLPIPDFDKHVIAHKAIFALNS